MTDDHNNVKAELLEKIKDSGRTLSTLLWAHIEIHTPDYIELFILYPDYTESELENFLSGLDRDWGKGVWGGSVMIDQDSWLEIECNDYDETFWELVRVPKYPTRP